MMTTVDVEDTETMTQESDCFCESDMNSDNANTVSSMSTANVHRIRNNGHGRRRRLYHIILVATTAFVWMVPWLLVQEIGAVRNPPMLNRRDETMSNAEVRNYLKIYNAGSTSVIPQSSTTPLPSPTKPKSPSSPNSSNSRANIVIRPKPRSPSLSGQANFSTTTARSSFIPTEVMPASSSTTTAAPLAKYLQEALPTPAKQVQEDDSESSASSTSIASNDTVGELFQSLNILHTLLGTNANADDITSALLPTLTTTTTTPASTTDENPALSFDESLQALSLLNSLLGNNNNGNANDAGVNNINLGSSNALLASLGLPQEPSSVGTRQANQLGLSEPLTSSLANLLFGGQSNVNNPPQQQNFLNFKNTGSQMDSQSTTTQLSGLMGLLNTLGQFGGSSQSSSLFNFAQAPSQNTPNYLSSLFRPSQQQQQQQTPNYLSLLFGNNAQQTKTPAQTQTSDFLATILNGGSGKSAQDVSVAPPNNLLGSLLGSSSNTQNNLFGGLLGAQQQQQQPSLASSLGTIGTSLASIAGTALTGLSGSNGGKPRVRGMDTRLGLGYRFGPNADAQVLWEIGPQLFTEPLPNEQREQLIKMREQQARKQLEQQQQQVMTLQQQLRQLEEEKRFRELQAEERVRQAAAEAAREVERRTSEMQQAASTQRLRKTNKRHRPYPSWSEILFSPDATAESLAALPALLPTAMTAQVRPRPKQSGVSRFNPATAILPQPTAKSKRANSILTTYEKHLLQQPAVAPSAQPAAEFARRTVNAPAPIHVKRNIQSPALLQRTNQFIFSRISPNLGAGAGNRNQNRIVRMRQINRRPIPLPPVGQRLSRDKIRHTKMRSIPLPPQHPVPIGVPNGIENTHGAGNQFQSRMGVAMGQPPQQSPQQHLSAQANNPTPRQHLRRRQRNANNVNQENIITEREDSFIRRNAGPYMPHVPQRMPHRGPPPRHFNQNRRTILDVGDDGLPAILSKIRPSVNSVFEMWNHMKTSGNPLTRLMSAENTIPSPDQVVPPDSLDTFNCYFCNGDYVPTTKPPLVARPLPLGHNVTVQHPHAHPDSHTAASNQNPAAVSGGTRRLPGLVSKIKDTVINRITGGGPKRDQHTSDSEPRPAVHIGANLTPEQLTNLMSPHLSQQGHRDNPYITTAKIKYQTDQMLSFIPTHPRATPTTVAPPPIHVPGVEMFIDIDNGDISVRKNIGKLTGFDEDDFTTTTPRPKTEEELEEEESQKIFQQVQEYLHNSYEEMKFNQALEKEMKKYKDKLSSGQDEMSHGAVSQMFDVLAKRQGVVDPFGESESASAHSARRQSSKKSSRVDLRNSGRSQQGQESFISSTAREPEEPTDPLEALFSPVATTSKSARSSESTSSTSSPKKSDSKKLKLESGVTIASTSRSSRGASSSTRSHKVSSTVKATSAAAAASSTTPAIDPEEEDDLDSIMDSSEEYEDSGNESSGEDVEFAMEKDDHGPVDPEENTYPFTVLSTGSIVQHMIDSIKEANTVLQLPTTTMRILLNYFGWDKEKLLEGYYDGDQEKLYKDAHIINPNKSRALIPPPPSGVEDCDICYLQKPSSMMYGLECGHRFCKQCWSEYLTTKIMEEGMGQTIACAAHNCPILVDDATVMALVTDPRVKLKYQHLITNSFVQCNRLMRWCPSADCTNAVLVDWVDWKPVICNCGYEFCFQCGHSWHDPVKCNWLKKWLKKCDDDSETSNWIAANTKECPRCNATIEKDGGCNHMVCKNQNCKADFCWVCLGPWEPHGSSWYNCNRFDETEARAARDAQEKSRSALQRYLFYCNRYMNHMQSLKFEHKLYASVKDKMEEMQQHNMSWIEVQFLKRAVDILCKCRQTLMYTYIFAFYLGRTNQSVLFEDNQRDLESATEKLSEYLERDITSENLADIKQKVQDKYRYCESRREVLLKHVYEGYEKDWWVYNEN